MAFISDHSVKRTWDPDRGIELKFDRRMSDGTFFMRLVQGDAVLHFFMDRSYEESDPKLIVDNVNYPQTSLGGFSVHETADIMREALVSFKGVYGLQPDEHVRVDFKMPPTDEEVIRKLTTTVAQLQRLAKERPDSAEFFERFEEEYAESLAKLKAKQAGERTSQP